MPAAKKKGAVAPKKAARSRVTPLATPLAEAAWAEADRALAEALAELDRAEHADNEMERADAVLMLAQALGRVSRKRGFSRIGVVGKREAFDAARHELVEPGKPKTVRILTRGVMRGGQVLIKARVAPARRGKRT